MGGSSDQKFDLIVVGGGPAGSTAAIYATRLGLKTLLLDKARFPRDKICGDAIGGKSIHILRELGLLDDVAKLPGARINTIVFGSPANVQARIDLTRSRRKDFMMGFVVRRRIFDNFLFERARNETAACLEGFTVEDVLMDGARVCGVRGHDQGQPREVEFQAPVVLGADGYKSVIAQKTGLYDPDLRHWVVALRQYYANVDGLGDQIELHYVKDVLPGYFWIFPLESGYANVGIGMLPLAMKRGQVNIRDALQRVISSPHFRERFARATPCENPIGWNLPLGSKHRKIHGNGFMLAGDAAGLIDPFTGEGIANAMWSARCAAEEARAAHDSHDFSEAFLSRYDRTLWEQIGDELRVSSKLQRIGQYKSLLNFTIRKAARNPKVADIICGMIAHEIPRRNLANPLFYLGLVFR